MTVQVRSSGVAGDGLFALKATEAGKTLLVIERPLLTALSILRLPDTCSNCFIYKKEQPSMKLQTCIGCHTLRYCSKRCQSQSWKRTHKHECKLLGHLSQHGPLPNAPRVVLQMIQLMSQGRGDQLKDLMSHYPEMLKAGGDRLETLQILAKGIHEYSGKPIPLEQVYELFASVYTNGLTLTSPGLEHLGLVVDPLISKVNHSCDPNAAVIYNGPRLSLRSMKPIETDEEIFIIYVDATNPTSRRQTDLQNQYYFQCRCHKCEQGTESVTDTFHPGRDSPSSSALAVIEKAGFAAMQQIKDPALSDKQILSILDKHIKTCQDTLVWPAFRQPLAALHHERFLTLLSLNRYHEALKCGLYVQCSIYPFLYPQEAHLMRAVHIFTLARLTMHLQGPEQTKLARTRTLTEEQSQVSLPDEIDLAEVTSLLMQDAETAVGMSHGKDNKLTEEVVRTRTLWEDERRAVGKTSKKGENAVEEERRVHKIREMLRACADG